MQPLKTKNIRVKGELERRLRLSVQRLIELKDENLVWSTHARYSADFPGRWIDTMALLNDIGLVQDDACIKQVAQELLDIQCPEGCYASSADYCRSSFRADVDVADEGMESVAPLVHTVWFGECRGLMGLLTLYEVTGDQRYLDSVGRAADFALETIDVSRWPERRSTDSQQNLKHCLVSITEGLIHLSSIAGGGKYAPLIRSLVEFLPPIAPEVGVQHAHYYFSALRGVLDSYEADKDPQVLDFVVRQWQTVVDEHMMPTGGIPENFPDYTGVDETCQCADWVRLNLQLWRVTGQAKYMEMAELALLNHIYFEQWANGGFEFGAQLDRGVRWFEMYFCCSMNGPRVLVDVAQHIITYERDSISLNFLFGMQAQVPLAQGQINVEVDSDFPRRGSTRIKLGLPESMAFAFFVRVPAGCENPQLTVNGQAVAAKVEQGYLRCRRQWEDGDAVELTFDMPLRFVPCANSDGANMICRGPIIMALRRRIQPEAYQEVEEALAEVFVHGVAPEASLTVDGTVYSDCLTGTDSYCQIMFNVPPGVDRLVGKYAMPPGQTTDQKSGQFHIYLDGKECFDSGPVNEGAGAEGFDFPIEGAGSVLLAAECEDFYKGAPLAWMDVQLMPAGQRLGEMTLVETVCLPVDPASLKDRTDQAALSLVEPVDENWKVQAEVSVVTNGKPTEDKGRIPIVLVPLAEVCYDEIPEKCICEGFYRHTRDYNRQESQYRLFFRPSDSK